MSEPVYLDYNSTTPVAPEAAEAMLAAVRDGWGNPSSAHVYGRRARAIVERARGEVAELLGSAPDEIVFTSGGTESDNLAILGVAEARGPRGRHVVISAIEHAAVDRPCALLESRGWDVTRVGVGPDGRVDAAAVIGSVRPDTALVSVMHANNETGVLQPVGAIGRAVRARGVVFHTDAAQSAGKIPVRVDDLEADLVTLAGHKLYGPQGVGALYVRRGTPLSPLMLGAGHERGLRSGTESVAHIAGIGAACALAQREALARTQHLRHMRDRLEHALHRRFPDLVVHGSHADRLPNTASVALPGVLARDLVASLTGVATSAGAACHSGGSAPSRVLRAMGVPDELALCTLRLTVGRPTTAAEVDAATAEIGERAGSLAR